MSTTYVLLPTPTPSGNDDNSPDASGDAFTDDVPRTTVTITSFYTAESTSASSPSGSGSNSSTSPGSRKFAALAIGGALGGFALTCLIGWAIIWWWRKRWLARRMAGTDGEGGSAPVLGIGALRTDAENFPGWRRTVASRLQETDGRSQASVTDVNERRSSSFAPPSSLGGKLLTHMEEVRPNFVTRPPGSKSPLLPLPPTAASELTRECTKAFSRVGRSRASISSKSSSSVGAVDKSPRSPTLGNSHLAFLQEHRSEEDGSETVGHGAVAEGSGAPGLMNASAQRVNDLASQDSHSSSQFYSPSAATHPPPVSYYATHPQFYNPGNAIPPRDGRTPSPVQHRRNSASSQASAGGFGVASPSSWHGHTSAPQRPGHASWHGPSLAMHWSGHLPHFGRGDGGAPASGSSGAGGPPSSWLGHFHPTHHHARSFSGSALSSQRPLLSNDTSNGSGSSGSGPAPPPNALIPPQPKFFFQPPSAAGSRAPSPPPPSPPPSPLDPPPTVGRLTVTNPDLNSSPATSSVNLPEDEKSPTKPLGTTPPKGKSPLSQ